MKKLSLFAISAFLCVSAKAQFNQWTWIHGDNITNQVAIYGTQGVAAAANKPRAFYEGGGEWVDLQGNFWHFGAGGFGGYGAALWKYDPNTNMFTWVKGPNTMNSTGVYGTKGVANMANYPSGRAFASLTWTDLQGNLWMFGGYGYHATGGVGWLNDMWKYDIGTNMWTWMGGSNNTFGVAGVYGTKGVGSVNNYPGARCETDAAWCDAQGKFWIFGGLGYDANGGNGNLNDLWKYDPITGQWTWVSGDNVVNQAAVYGVKGVAAAANKPSGRMNYASWKDNSGNFWIFGSRGSGGQYDDLWKYDPNTNMWTWMEGNAGAGNTAGTYGTKCVGSPNNNPPALYEQRARWEDDCGNFWLWGGNSHNDLWMYSHTTGNWTWVSGSNLTGQAGVYGTKGVSAATNMPGARCGNLPFRRPNVNELWFMGGGLPGDFNDVWRYVPDKPTASFTFTPNNACFPANVAFTSTSTPGCNEIKGYAWNFGDPSSGTNNVSSLQNPNHVFNNMGNYVVKLVVTNCTGSKDSTTQIVTVTSCGFSVVATGSQICSGACGSVTATAQTGTSPYTYSWSPGGQTTQNINPCPTITTVYSITVTDANGATATATAQVTVSQPMNLGTTSTNVSCNGGNNGSATVSSVTSGTAPYTYSWAGGYGTTGFATGLTSGTYTCTVTDFFGCSKTATMLVTQPPALVLNPSSTNVLCNGGNSGTASVTATGGTANYTYVWSNGQSTQNATGLTAGTFTVTVTDANGCSRTTTVGITQPAAIATTVTVTATTCLVGGTATATNTGGTGSYTYSWSNGQTSQTATGLAIGNYTVTVTDANNCTQTASATITGIAGPTAAGMSLVNNALCFGGNTGDATATATGGTGSYTYSWNNGQTSQQATGLSAGQYTVTISDNNGCTITASVVIGEPAQLTATANGINACSNATATGSAAGGTVNYTWLWSNGQTTQNATGLSTGTYTLTVTDANGCTAQDTAVINISPPPVVAFTADDTAGCAPLCVNLTCTTGNIASYTWDFGDGSTFGSTSPVNHCYKTPGTYSVTLTVTDNNGCTGTLTRNNYISVFPNVIAAFSASPQPTTVLNPIVSFTDQSLNGAISWSWTFGDLLNSTSALQNPSFNFKDSGCYNVRLIADNQYNCPDTAEQLICIQGDYELYAPNAFTPDANGLNDVWNVKGIGISTEDFELYIFDRWGNLIFKTTDLYEGWNGKANGGKEIAQQDVYVWKVFAKDFLGGKHTYIGHVTLVR